MGSEMCIRDSRQTLQLVPVIFAIIKFCQLCRSDRNFGADQFPGCFAILPSFKLYNYCLLVRATLSHRNFPPTVFVSKKPGIIGQDIASASRKIKYTNLAPYTKET